MKIAIISNSSTGLFNFRQELICELAKNNNVFAITPDNGNLEKIESLGCRVIEVPVDRRGINPIKDCMLFFRYMYILIKEKPNHIITYTIKPNIYGGFVASLLGIKYSCNITGLGSSFQSKGILKSIVVSLYKLALKKVHKVFFENKENKEIFIAEGIIGNSKACLLAGAGVNLDRFSVMKYPCGEETNFLFMGRIMKEKGINELFFAMQKLVKEGFKVHLDVLGEYEEGYEEKIKSAESEGWLSYYGYQVDVKPYIEKSHCFVLPSWHEGMANTNLECAASGRPVITTNIHGCLEAVENNVTGFLVESKNPTDLYTALKKFVFLSYDDRREMGLAGRERMKTFFDKNIVVRKTIDCLFE